MACGKVLVASTTLDGMATAGAIGWSCGAYLYRWGILYLSMADSQLTACLTQDERGVSLLDNESK